MKLIFVATIKVISRDSDCFPAIKHAQIRHHSIDHSRHNLNKCVVQYVVQCVVQCVAQCVQCVVRDALPSRVTHH